MAIKGGLLRVAMMICYFVAFGCASIVTGAFAWFTVSQFGARNLASLVIGAITVLYTMISCILTCCTAGIPVLSFFKIIADVLFAAAVIGVSVINRSGRHSCRRPPFPRVVYRGSGSTGCELFRAAFAVAIISVVMFVGTAILQFVIRRRGRRDGSGFSSSKV